MPERDARRGRGDSRSHRPAPVRRAGAGRSPRAARRRPLAFDGLEGRVLLDGQLDPIFGTAGRVSFRFQGDYQQHHAQSVAIRDDGAILVGGTAKAFIWPLILKDVFGVVQLDRDGVAVASHAVGFVYHRSPDQIITASNDRLGEVLQTPGGTVLVGTVSLFGEGSFDFGDVGLARVAWDAPGYIPVSTAYHRLSARSAIHAAAALPDGRIIAAGGSRGADRVSFVAARFGAGGEPDGSFNAGRSDVVVPFGTGDSVARNVTIQADGKIVLAGGVNVGDNADFAVVRLNPDGTLDAGFGDGGRVTIPFDLGGTRYASAAGVVIQADGRIVLAGSAATDQGSTIAVARLNPDGTLDAGFGDGGRVLVSARPNGIRKVDFGNAVALQRDGRILVAGESLQDAIRSEFAIARLHRDGTLDRSFGEEGVAIVPFEALGPSGPPRSAANALAIQADGNIVVVGQAYFGGFFAVARLLADTTPPAVLGLSGVVSDLRREPVGSVDVRLSEPIDPSRLDVSALSLTRDGVAVPLDGRVVVRDVAGTAATYRIEGLGAFTAADGSYELIVGGAAFRDDAGHAGIGSAAATFVIDATPPAVLGLSGVVPGLRREPVGSVDVRLSEPIDPSRLDVSALSLTRDGVAVPLDGRVGIRLVAGTAATYRIEGLGAFTAADGGYTLVVPGAAFRDHAGNVGVESAAVSFVVDATPPRLLGLELIGAGPGRLPVGSARVVLSEPVDPVGLGTLAVTLTRGGVPVALGGAITVAAVPGELATYRIDGLAPLSRPPGAYVLRVSIAGLSDAAGNAADGSAAVTFRRLGPAADFDGDGVSDFATFTRVAAIGVGRLEVLLSGGGTIARDFGRGAVPLSGDFDGDGKADLAAYEFDPVAGLGRFIILRSSDGVVVMTPFGGRDDLPVVGDFDGDGIADLAVFGFSPLDGVVRFGVLLSSTNRGFSTPFGGRDDLPVVGDFDGDGADDLAVFGFSPLDGVVRTGILPSSGGPARRIPFGGREDVPAVGDFDGDGLADVAVFGFSPLDGIVRLAVLPSSGGPARRIPFGGREDVPAVGDFDGDGLADVAVFGFSPLEGHARFALVPSGGPRGLSRPAGSRGSIPVPVMPSPPGSAGVVSAAWRVAPAPGSPEGGDGPPSSPGPGPTTARRQGPGSDHPRRRAWSWSD